MKKAVLILTLQLLITAIKAQSVICVASYSESFIGGTPDSMGSNHILQVFKSLEDSVEVLGFYASNKITLNKGDLIKYELNTQKLYHTYILEESIQSQTTVIITRTNGTIEKIELNEPHNINTEKLSYKSIKDGVSTIGEIKIIPPISKHIAMPCANLPDRHSIQ